MHLIDSYKLSRFLKLKHTKTRDSNRTVNRTAVSVGICNDVIVVDNGFSSRSSNYTFLYSVRS